MSQPWKLIPLLFSLLTLTQTAPGLTQSRSLNISLKSEEQSISNGLDIIVPNAPMAENFSDIQTVYNWDKEPWRRYFVPI